MKYSLCGEWDLRGEFLDVTADRFMEVLTRPEGTFGIEFSDKGPKPFPYRQGFMKACVPGDVSETLIQYGLLQEPLEDDNTKNSLWVKELSWWFKKEFEVSEHMLQEDAIFLYIEMLDYNASIIINGFQAGTHKNAFVPFYEDIKRFLHAGSNTILIRLTTGMEDFYERDSITFYNMSSQSICDQRIYTRKPQFTYGWDWCKPVPTCGIGRDIYLEAISGAKISAFRADTLCCNEQQAVLDIHFELDNVHDYTVCDSTLSYCLQYGKEPVYERTVDLYLPCGLTYWSEQITIPSPHLWWPNGYGEQALYTVTAHIQSNRDSSIVPMKETCYSMPQKQIGIRTISLNQDIEEDGTRKYEFQVNGVIVFCKGGNWVPADSLYLRIKYSTYKKLLSEAKEANFTMLRIWGGGTYEPDYFYELCSQYGILIMHDFMYACAFYPDQEDWFIKKATEEADYQTKRLAHYPCMAIWTGNNEIHESISEWFPERIAPLRFYGRKIFNYIQPSIVHKNCPNIAYAPSSPYFGALPNNMDSGDSHVWKWLGRAEETKMQYRGDISAFTRLKTRFSSEYGFHGALTLSSIQKYFTKESPTMDSPVWSHHGESFWKHNGIMENIKSIYGITPMNLNDYLLYSGLAQGYLYSEMAKALRCKPECSGNLIWMYNDCWPETGWSIIDYYTTRKISYYYLKRAYSPLLVVCQILDQNLHVTCMNETKEEISLPITIGYQSFDGSFLQGSNEKDKENDQMKLQLVLAPHSIKTLPDIPIKKDTTLGYFYAVSPLTKPATTVSTPFHRYNFAPCNPSFVFDDACRETDTFSIVCDQYCPLVYLTHEDETVLFDDNFIEVLPNTPYRISLNRKIDCSKIILHTIY